MTAALALIFAATPVSVQLDLSRQTKERVGLRLEDSIRQRLLEEGFEVRSPARLQLRVDELHGVFRLTAQVAKQEPLTRELAPTGNEWRDELMLEIAQRLVSLAHEAELLIPTPPLLTSPAVPAPPPENEPIAAADQDQVGEPNTSTLKVGAGVRAGIAFRLPGADPTLAFHGVFITGVVEPVMLVGLTLAPGLLFVTEFPLLAGIRLRTAPRDAPFAVIPEALIGARIHVYGASPLDDGGARVDFMGTVGATASFNLGSIRLGLRVGLELAPGREHVFGSVTLWQRSPVTLSLQLVVERS